MVIFSLIGQGQGYSCIVHCIATWMAVYFVSIGVGFVVVTVMLRLLSTLHVCCFLLVIIVIIICS